MAYQNRSFLFLLLYLSAYVSMGYHLTSEYLLTRYLLLLLYIIFRVMFHAGGSSYNLICIPRVFSGNLILFNLYLSYINYYP